MVPECASNQYTLKEGVLIQLCSVREGEGLMDIVSTIVSWGQLVLSFLPVLGQIPTLQYLRQGVVCIMSMIIT